MHDGYWPGLSHDDVLDLPYFVWVRMALASDAQAAETERVNAEIKARTRG